MRDGDLKKKVISFGSMRVDTWVKRCWSSSISGNLAKIGNIPEGGKKSSALNVLELVSHFTSYQENDVRKGGLSYVLQLGNSSVPLLPTSHSL